MKIPERPPTLPALLQQLAGPDGVLRLAELLAKQIGPAPDGKYRHWDTLRHVTPPEGLSSEEWWLAIKLARTAMRREIPLRDAAGRPFSYTLPDPALAMLHTIDRDAAGQIASSESIVNPSTRDRYIQSSLVEEAITSSQLEGAATTREVAREMLRSGRRPLDRSEQMIHNNYRAIRLVAEHRDQSLTHDFVLEVMRTITADTLDVAATSPFQRKPGDGIRVYDADHRVLHDPPHASEIDQRMTAMIAFANEDAASRFMHPVVRSILLHFWLAYDHPFVDGNGRTARALFYWSMLRHGYWMAEFISISRILRKAHGRYSRSFLYTETDENDLTYFLLAQLEVLRLAIVELLDYLRRKTNEVQATERLLRSDLSLNHRQLALVTHALRHPGLHYTVDSHRVSHGVVYQTARTDLLDLEARGLLDRIRPSSRKMVFAAPADLAERVGPSVPRHDT